MAITEMTSEEFQTAVVKARLGMKVPELVDSPTHPYRWCGALHPEGGFFICSRKLDHTGPHLAMYSSGFICQVRPNPW